MSVFKSTLALCVILRNQSTSMDKTGHLISLLHALYVYDVFLFCQCCNNSGNEVFFLFFFCLQLFDSFLNVLFKSDKKARQYIHKLSYHSRTIHFIRQLSSVIIVI